MKGDGEASSYILHTLFEQIKEKFSFEVSIHCVGAY